MKKKSELEKLVAALPPNPKKAYNWTLDQDSIILKYADEKGSDAIARVLGLNGVLVRRRLAVLKQKVGKK